MPQEDEVVRRAPLFTALDDAQAASLRASMTNVKVTKGHTLFKEGDEGDRLYVVVEGKLKLGTTSVDGRENLSLKQLLNHQGAFDAKFLGKLFNRDAFRNRDLTIDRRRHKRFLPLVHRP